VFSFTETLLAPPFAQLNENGGYEDPWFKPLAVKIAFFFIESARLMLVSDFTAISTLLKFLGVLLLLLILLYSCENSTSPAMLD